MQAMGVTKGCESCEYRATSKGHLTKHEIAVHEGILADGVNNYSII